MTGPYEVREEPGGKWYVSDSDGYWQRAVDKTQAAALCEALNVGFSVGYMRAKVDTQRAIHVALGLLSG